ncbi:MAG TPA: Co2+/Mg2+ efflux protein ApaG [Rubricoccaceae bacterium]|nr:Co2+/Mg2+ efflux protein ApaG [Rubricoccaceae bacterium]
MVSYDATTDEITVTVRPVYLDGQSDLLQKKFAFAYFIEITNHGEGEVQLLRRHWRIVDGNGHVKEVEGAGVVGKQPVIPPGGSHTYNSFCELTTFEGTMEGTYLMQRENGDRFRAQIPRFHLRAMAN